MKKVSRFLSVLLAVAVLVTLAVVGLAANADVPAAPKAAGYAAVGKVDTAAGKVEALFDDGVQGAVKYIGDAPAAGAVYTYTRDANNYYLFTPAAELYGKNQLTDSGTTLGLGYDSQGWAWAWWQLPSTAYNHIYFYNGTPGTPVFVRLSATSWKLGYWDVWKNNIDTTAPMYLLNCADHGAGTAFTAGVGVIGTCEGGAIAAPGVNYPEGDARDLSAFSDLLHDYATGYAAVGKVDAAESKAEVLLGTGEQGWVKFAGTAPTAGAVYKYTRDGENIYTFTTLKGNPGEISDQLADGGWNIQFGGAVDNLAYPPYMWDASSNLYLLSQSTPVFIRYSETSWRLTDWSIGSTVTNNDGSCTAYFLNMVSPSRNATFTYDVGAVVIGQYSGGAITEPNLSGMGSPVADKDLNEFTAPLHDYEPDTPTPEPPPETPAIVATGYAAVGFVDTAASKAEVLLGTGQQGWVTYTGTAPTAGAVYKYSCDDGNVYTFTELKAGMAANGNQLTDAGMNVQFGGAPDNADYPPYMWDGAATLYGLTEATPVFVRHSATEWGLMDWSIGGSVVANDGSITVYVLDVTSPGAKYTCDVGAVVIGQCADGAVSAPALADIGSPVAEFHLGALSAPLHQDEIPPTGDVNVPLLVAVMVVSAVALLAALFAFERKKAF